MTSKKEKQAKALLKRGKIIEAIDIYNNLAHEYQKAGELEKAIEMCTEGSSLAVEHHQLYEGSFCERLLAEIHASLGNRNSCLTHLSEFRRMAKRCSNQSQEQLSYHVEAWCLQQLFLNGEGDADDLEKAVKALHTSQQLVDNFKKAFKEGDSGGTPRIRKAQMFILEAQLLENLGKASEALELLDQVERMLNSNDKLLRFDVRRVRLGLVPIERRPDIAELMDDEAPEDKKAQTICELSHHYILSGRLVAGYQKLALAYIGHAKQLNSQEMDDFVKRLCILYRLVHYEKILKNSRLQPKISLCELHEAIGDLYDKYYQTMLEKEKTEYRQFVRTNILRNYEKMLEHQRNDNDAIRAYLAMALVYGDLGNPREARDLLEKRLEILERTGASEEKILDTRISILDCQCKQHLTGLEPIFQELNEKVTLKSSQRELYDTWANYWTGVDAEAARKWRNEAEAIPDVMVKNEDDETDVLFGKLSDETILQMCADENKLLKLETMTDYQRKKTNDKGETILHTAAMEHDSKMVEKLCKMGCEVNAKDHGGWTPLAEAVSHDRLENVRVLLRYGADINSRSAESFVNEDSCESNETNHSRLTPLMEACTNGFVSIARLLVESKARIELKDSAGWTALDHLRNFIRENDSDKSHLDFELFLKSEMDRCNFPIKIPLSLATSSRRNLEETDDLQESQLDDEEECLILDNVASRKRRNSNNSELNIPKRRPRSGENLRPSPLSTRKRGLPSRRSNSPVHRRHPSPPTSSLASTSSRFVRNSSFNSQRHSMSPSRRSLSPSMTIRSAPSIFGKEDDVQIVGEKRNTMKAYLRTQKSISPRIPPPPTTSTPQQVVPRQSPRLPPPPSSPQNDTVAVKCSFELPTGCQKDKIPTVMLPLPRTLTIGETKLRVLSHIKSSDFKKVSVWKQEDVEKCLLADELSLSHLPDHDLALVFQLMAPSAYEVYQETKDPLPEVADRLEHLSTDLFLDLSGLFLEENELLEVTRTFKKCERPAKFRLDISGTELSPEDESNIRQLLPTCHHLTIGAVISRTGFWEIFDRIHLENLEILELTAIEFKDETQISRILEKCENVKSLKLAGIRISNFEEEKELTMVPQAIKGLSKLQKLDLSFNNTWLSVENWRRILSNLEHLEELVMMETWSQVLFESDWLPALRKFTARGSHLHWDSIGEWLSILEKIEKIDLRYTDIDAEMIDLLRNGNLEILY